MGFQVINSFKLLCLKYVFISSFLKDTFSGYRTLGWQFFPFSTLKLLLHSFLSCTVSNEKSTVILVFVPQYFACLFSFATLKFFSFLLVLINLIRMWFGIVFFRFCVGEGWIFWATWICGFAVFKKLKNFSTTVSSDFSVVSLLSLGIPIIHIFECLKLSHSSLMCLYTDSFSTIFSL